MLHDIVAEGLKFPEGPLVLPDGDLLICEMAPGRIARVTMDGKASVIAETGGGPCGAALGPDGAAYICNSGGFLFRTTEEGHTRVAGLLPGDTNGSIQRVDLVTGEVRTLYDRCNGEKLKGTNDLVFDRDGGLWFTDYGKIQAGKMDMCHVYYCRIDGSFIRPVTGPFFRPNGIGLSPDDKTLYVVETVTGRLWAFDIAGPGEIRRYDKRPVQHGGRHVYTMTGHARGDSMAVEDGGNICIATLGEEAVTVVSPDGELVELIRYPDPMVTNLCFGGSDMRDAFVTLSATGRIARSRWSRPGLKLPHQRS